MKNTIKEQITEATARERIDRLDLKMLKTSYMAGYMSRTNLAGEWYHYIGRYGAGVVHITPCFETSRYVRISYYV